MKKVKRYASVKGDEKRFNVPDWPVSQDGAGASPPPSPSVSLACGEAPVDEPPQGTRAAKLVRVGRALGSKLQSVLLSAVGAASSFRKRSVGAVRSVQSSRQRNKRHTLLESE